MSTMPTVLRRISLVIVLLLVGFSALARAQQFSGTLKGSVEDSTGAVVPGAQVGSPGTELEFAL